MKRHLTFVLVWLGAIFVASIAHGQITGTITGTVVDQTGAVVPGATVTAASPNLLRSDVFSVANQQGRYRLVGLTAGVYELSVQMDGFAPKRLTEIRLGLNETKEVKIVLELAGIAEQATVVARAPVVEVKSSGLGLAILPEVIDTMPLKGREFLDLMGLVPGTAPRVGNAIALNGDQGAAVTVFAERSVTNSFLVDGMMNKDDYTGGFAEFYIQDVIQEFKVELGGYQAEFGRASGAVANIITKSGGNDFGGRGFFFLRDDGLNSTNVPDQDPPQLRRTEVGGTFGGPIARDKTWFFAAGQIVNEARGSTLQLTAVPRVLKDGWFTPTSGQEIFDAKPDAQRLTLFGKVNHQFSPSQNLYVTVNMNLGEELNSLPPGGGHTFIPLNSTSNDYEKNTYSATGRHTAFFGGDAFLESSLRYLRIRNQTNTEKTLGAEFIYPGTFNEIGQAQFWITNASSEGITDLEHERYQWMQTMSAFRETDNWGRHDLKFGFDFTRVNFDRSHFPPSYLIVSNTLYQREYQNLDIGTVEVIRNEGLTLDDRTRSQAANNVLGAFGQDSWEVRDGLTINAGIRYDYASLFSEDKDNFAPRIGVAWDPKSDGKTVLRASFGIYYDQNILELAQEVPELGGIQGLAWSHILIPRGASWFDNPAIGAFDPLHAGGTRWLAHPEFFSHILPEGAERCAGDLCITGQGRPHILYELLGVPVTDPLNPPILEYGSIEQLTGGRFTPEEALQTINNFFGPHFFNRFGWAEPPDEGSVISGRYMQFFYRTNGPAVTRLKTLQHPVKTPYTRSFNFGIAREIVGDFSIDAAIFIRRSRDLLASRVINLRDIPRGAGCFENTTDSGPCNNQVGYSGFLDANVFTLALEKRFSNGYQFLGSYTYTDAVDNFTSYRVPPRGASTSFLFNNQPELDIGRSLMAPNQVFTFSGVVRMPYGIHVSGILNASSGLPFNASGFGVDSDGDGIFDNRLATTEKGEFATDSLLNVDMRLAKTVKLSSSRALTVLVEMFNLTNEANPARIITAFGEDIGLTIEPLPGRELQIGVRFDF